MNFDSWAAFWDMGGYGVFVWSCYGITFVTLAILAAYTVRYHSRMRDELTRLERLQQRGTPP